MRFFEGSFLPVIEEEDEDVDDSSLPCPLMRFLLPFPGLMLGPLLLISLKSVPSFVRPCCEFTSGVEPLSTLSLLVRLLWPLLFPKSALVMVLRQFSRLLWWNPLLLRPVSSVVSCQLFVLR